MKLFGWIESFEIPPSGHMTIFLYSLSRSFILSNLGLGASVVKQL